MRERELRKFLVAGEPAINIWAPAVGCSHPLIPHLSPLYHLSPLIFGARGTARPSGKAAALRAAGERGGPGARRARSLWSRLERRPGDAASRRARRPGPEALSEYARAGWALVLFEIGDRDQSIAEMEHVSIALKGYPEIHAA
ncbi:uncharacterized protein LOC120681080 [Panicum virgatum]|uniref:uncharacterized protein LOC120681080 n=1 Tax=Panicum virgatum TaxID=38727 RepID=UPI0019D505FF|nr:uncharacterized protein LOC120681080 [Panicum virgatum]